MKFFSLCIQQKIKWKRKKKKEKKSKKENWIDVPANRLKYDWNYFIFL